MPYLLVGLCSRVNSNHQQYNGYVMSTNRYKVCSYSSSYTVNILMEKTYDAQLMIHC